MNDQKYHGVNLGGWLVLEKWMTPKLFEQIDAEDQYCFCLELGRDTAEKKLHSHWQNYITKEDFIWIKDQGLNAVRIPIGYWDLEPDDPFISSTEYFEKALEWAKEAGLKVIVNIHAAPGSQNGWDHSGRSGEITWNKAEINIERTLSVIEIFADKYGQKDQIVGIGLLNEPHWDIPTSTLIDFYKRGYEIIRNKTGERITVIFDDNFRKPNWEKIFRKNNFKNVFLDLHLYQCFKDEDKALDIYGHLQKTVIEWKNTIETAQKYIPVMIGEWSLGLDPQSLIGLNETQKKLAKKAYLDAQLLVFEQAAGWFFWSYKVENDVMKSDWSYRDITILDK